MPGVKTFLQWTGQFDVARGFRLIMGVWNSKWGILQVKSPGLHTQCSWTSIIPVCSLYTESLTIQIVKGCIVRVWSHSELKSAPKFSIHVDVRKWLFASSHIFSNEGKLQFDQRRLTNPHIHSPTECTENIFLFSWKWLYGFITTRIPRHALANGRNQGVFFFCFSSPF